MLIMLHMSNFNGEKNYVTSLSCTELELRSTKRFLVCNRLGELCSKI